MQTLITARHLIAPDRVLDEPMVLIEDGRIVSIGSRTALEEPSAAVHLDYPGTTLAPALFDVHTHGARGADVMEATPEALETVGGFLAQHGVAAYLPTTISASRETTLRSLERLARLLDAEPVPGRARPLGIHLEGPFLSHIRRGTHAVRDLAEPSIPFFNEMCDAAGGHVRLLTVAPELPGALELIAHAVSRGIHISIGHSDANTVQTAAAIALGACSATHTFNAMRPLSQRDPGILGTVLTDDRVYAEFICDGVHTAPSIAKLFARAKGDDRAILITDAMSATGMPDGTYKLGELDVQVHNGRATTDDNTIAGSTLILEQGVRNYMQFAEVPLATAVHAAARNPARMLQLEPEVGLLEPGHRADLLALNSAGELQVVLLGGQPPSA